MRLYLILIFAIGIMASIASHLPSASPTRAATANEAGGSGEPQEAAELRTSEAPQVSSQDGAINLERSGDGHFYADVQVNGASLHMMVDTGASAIALSRDDARRAGIATSIGMPGVVGEGADGVVHGEFARLDRVELGPLSVQGLDAIVLNNGGQSLLGQNFLSKFRKVEIDGDRMRLQ